MKNEVLFAIAFLIFLAGFVGAAETVSVSDVTVCCEKTQSGLFCQDAKASQCDSSFRQVPTACESTSYCRQGYCFDSSEGTCLDNTPQLVCNAEGGVWSAEKPAQCDLGCCVLGDQAAFVTLTRCKKLSADFGLKTNYNPSIKNEVQCVLSVQGQEKGACVYDFEFEKTCKFTTRAECDAGLGDNSTGLKGDFHSGKLCSAEELGTNCGPTTDTLCSPGKDEVYFKDSCGNPANIYDASKINDKEYWSNVKTKDEVCNPNTGNPNSPVCGNCNYLLGTFCREADSKGTQPRYGEFICSDLNCKNTENGNSYRHGESWCVYDDAGKTGEGVNSVGSRFFRHICINGEEVVEQCADYRQEECIEDKIETTLGDFAQAACRVNRWQDCIAQTEKIDCENTDKRDCLWKEGDFDAAFTNNTDEGVCVPMNPPGLKFWEGDEARQICAQADASCVVTFEKGLFGGETCKENCDCLSEDWEKRHAELCLAMGDCGPNVNWQGQQGYKKGYNVSIETLKKQ